MRLNTYLTESISVKDAEDAAANLEKQCAPILKLYRSRTMGDKYLYRGVNHELSSISKHKSHLKDRRPMSTKRVIHDYLNELFQKKFGWPARNGVGVTGSEAEADIYGKTYIFFPVGKLKYVWSPDVFDLWGTIMSRNITHGEIQNKKGKGELIKLVKTYKDTGIDKAISERKEIYFNCKSYYLVDGNNKFGFGGFEILNNLGMSPE